MRRMRSILHTFRHSMLATSSDEVGSSVIFSRFRRLQIKGLTSGLACSRLARLLARQSDFIHGVARNFALSNKLAVTTFSFRTDMTPCIWVER
jgi:hypothetical protein